MSCVWDRLMRAGYSRTNHMTHPSYMRMLIAHLCSSLIFAHRSSLSFECLSTLSFVSRGSFTWVTQRIHMIDTTCLHEFRDASFVMHWHAWHDSFECVVCLMWRVRVTHLCDGCQCEMRDTSAWHMSAPFTWVIRQDGRGSKGVRQDTPYREWDKPPAPMNHVRIFKVRPRREAIFYWYTANTNHLHLTDSVRRKWKNQQIE